MCGIIILVYYMERKNMPIDMPNNTPQQNPLPIVQVEVPQAIPEKVYKSEKVGISKKTHDEHLKLWQGYANKTNEIRKKISELEIDPSKANQIYSEIRALMVDYSFAYQGYLNHKVYFETLGGDGGEAKGEVADLIKSSFGSFENWLNYWKAAGMAGRGWVYLCYNRADKRLYNYIGDAQNTFPIFDNVCILCMDLYEHAYYLDFQTARMKYIEAYLQCIDWDTVNKNLAEAKK